MKNPTGNPGILLPANLGVQKAPEVKRWKVIDSVGNVHEIDAVGFNPSQTCERVDFFIVNAAGGTLIQSTEMMQRIVCSFYSPAFITVLENPTPKPDAN